MPRFTTSANCTGTLSAAQKTPETARPRSETQPEWGKRGRPPPAMRGPEAATPRVTRYSATASIEAVIAGQGIAICSDVLVARELASGVLVKAFDLPLPGFGFYLIHLPDHPRQRIIASF